MDMDLRMCMLRENARVCMCVVSVFARYSCAARKLTRL